MEGDGLIIAQLEGARRRNYEVADSTHVANHREREREREDGFKKFL